MTNSLRERLEAAALKAEKQEDQEYWNREYSGDIELGRAKLEIKELKQEIKYLQDRCKVYELDKEALANAQEDYEDTIQDLEKQLEQDEEYLYESQLKSISWNLNRIANVLEEVVPNNKTVGENILRSIRKGARND